MKKMRDDSDEDFEDSEMQAAFNMEMQQKISGGL